MFESLLTSGAVQLVEVIFEQTLKLVQGAAEDYVKDFFKGCLKDQLIAAKPEVTKKAVAEALKAFFELVWDELEDQDLSQAEIRDLYEPNLFLFAKDDAVKPILGQAFDKDYSTVNGNELAAIWKKLTYKDKPVLAMPDGFDWLRVGKEYLKRVKKIIRNTPELKALLDTQLLEEIERNTKQLSPGFDLAKYKQRLLYSYGDLKLSTIDPNDECYRIKLWKMFIEQTVREALPPMHYDLPSDVKRQLQESEYLEDQLPTKGLESSLSKYFQQPAPKVLKAVADSQRAVILGDPGAGKSTLLQYLALDWVEGKTEVLPLLIELREYAIAKVNGFLEFLHCGSGADWQFDKIQLDQYLEEQPTLVMFDGLDEVFDRATQSTIIDDIICFAVKYPKAKILTTSRIIGYDHERFEHAEFRHLTIQPLNIEEIDEFIDRWYLFAIGNDPDKEKLSIRLKEAIQNSKAITILAENPLLLTMMAILNRGQELPRDRADLYEQSSRLLLYHWDFDRKSLPLTIDVGRKEKQEMLRLIAYEMQAGEEGLKGNLISEEQLTEVLTNYLHQKLFGEPRQKANMLIQQLQSRNFILCYRGDDSYGFIHRTFLEYFCALEIVNRFNKRGTEGGLTFEQLRDDVFEKHWQDETWHEVLRLICGMLNSQFSVDLIKFLMDQNIDQQKFIVKEKNKEYLKVEGALNLLIASDCFLEISKNEAVNSLQQQMIARLKAEVEQPIIPLSSSAAIELLNRISQHFATIDTSCLDYLKHLVQSSEDMEVINTAIMKIIFDFEQDSETIPYLKNIIQNSNSLEVICATITLLGSLFKEDPETLPYLKEIVLTSEDSKSQFLSLIWINFSLKEDPKALPYLKEIVQTAEHSKLRTAALVLSNKYLRNLPEGIDLLFHVVQNDPFVREDKKQRNPRQVALKILLEIHPIHPKTIELIEDRVKNDLDEQLREWATKQLENLQSPTCMDVEENK